MSTIKASPARKIGNRPRVTIVGAGVGGLSLAIRLTEMGYPVVILEARDEDSTTAEGAFLTLAPNGMNGLRALSCFEAVRNAGVNTVGIEIMNARGKELGFADQRDHEQAFGAPSVTLGRGALTRLLLARARAAGADVRFGARVAAVDANLDGVTVGLSDGATLECDLLVAADGLRSSVRALVFPDYPPPKYTGLIGTGGIVNSPVPSTDGVMRMTFGNKAFFGYIKEGDGPVYWFNSYAADERDTAKVANPETYARKIALLHDADPSENRAILHSVAAIERHYPVYDVPELPAWHRGRIVLIGDAAHAMGPHAGQGASMAIEDAIVLSACFMAEDQPQPAFARYEELRRGRVAEVVKLTARNSSQKRTSGPVGLFIRDLILPFLIPMGIRMGRRLLAQRIDIDPLNSNAA
jgi:2-polyprenyl-6-methoxyphenol hydroxylase-like FAD-dependent oxidoreductase